MDQGISDREPMSIRGFIIGITILVAIMVVLAGFLYFMVLTPPCCPPPETPDGSLLDAKAISETSGLIVFGDFLPGTDCRDLKILVSINGIRVGEIQLNDYYSSNVTWTNGPIGASGIFYDRGGPAISSGDCLTLEGLSPGNEYSFEFLYVHTDEIIPMTGVEPVFVTLS